MGGFYVTENFISKNSHLKELAVIGDVSMRQRLAEHPNNNVNGLSLFMPLYRIESQYRDFLYAISSFRNYMFDFIHSSSELFQQLRGFTIDLIFNLNLFSKRTTLIIRNMIINYERMLEKIEEGGVNPFISRRFYEVTHLFVLKALDELIWAIERSIEYLNDFL